MNGLLNNTDIEIRPAHADEWETAMELVWKTFLKFEAAEYGPEGTDNFLKFISGEELYKMFLNGDYKMAVAVLDGRIVGVSTMRARNHVSLLFVESSLHKRGVGKKLLKYMQEQFVLGNDVVMTVNAAPCAVQFYKKVGFVSTADRQVADGITFYPMTCVSAII